MASFPDVAESFDGVTLAGFFSGNITANQVLDPTSGTIDVFSDPNGIGRDSLQTLWVDDSLGGWTLNDVAIYDDFGSVFFMTFSDSSPALLGTLVADLSSFNGIQGIGVIGDVFAGNPDDARVIGQFSIIPEPSSILLLGLGATGLAMPRRRRPSQSARAPAAVPSTSPQALSGDRQPPSKGAPRIV